MKLIPVDRELEKDGKEGGRENWIAKYSAHDFNRTIIRKKKKKQNIFI